MSGFLKRLGTRRRLAIALALLVLLPAIFYSAYELTSLSRSEALIADVYRQQLDAVLFSLNQYAWDVANSWANSINGSLQNTGRKGTHFDTFLKENPSIDCLFLADSSLTEEQLLCLNQPRHTSPRVSKADIDASLRSGPETMEIIQRLFRLASSGYRKISSIPVGDSVGRQSLALVFVATSRSERPLIVALVLDAERFIREVLGQKMNEVAGDNFLLAVNKKGSETSVYSTGTMSPGESRQTKELWLFPDYVVGIRLKGETIEELVRDRFYRNLVLIGLLDAVLIAGAWFVYRTVKREVELAQLKSDFVSNVSHELKTPLSLIRMFGETLQMQRVPSEEKKREYYDTIVQETERLTRLVNNILNFSRMEAGRKEYHFAETDLNTVVGNVLKSYETHLVHEGFQVATELNGTTSRIAMDGEAVSEAILNIIDNAVKYSDTEKFIRIATGVTADGIYVEVEDHGIGIATHDQKKIFEKFYRVSSGLVHTTKGSGLGLTLVKHIMDAHGGQVTVKSVPGKGSTFRLSFPLHTN
jgi:two-component system phosphate regulon sensor histidine kinase PhoR